MSRDRVSLNILSKLNESVEKKTLTEMPQKVKVNRRVRAYDFKDLSPRVQSELSGRKDKLNSAKDAEERFNKDANLDLKNRLDAIIPNAFSDTTLARYKDGDYQSNYTYTSADYASFAKFICEKFPELEYNENSYGGRVDFYVGLGNENRDSDGVHDFREILSSKTNFDELRRQQKTAINNYLIEIYHAVEAAFRDNKKEFEARRSEYDKYTNISDKELEDELYKYWYDKTGRVLRAKNLDESFIENNKLTEATELDVEDYIEVYDFDELSDYIKNDIAGRRIKAQIQKMGDRMTEIIEEKFTEYMSARGLTLEPNQFSVDELLYNMTHERNATKYYGPSYDVSFRITTNELKSYFENNPDLVEKYGQDLIDKFFAYTDENKNDYTKGTPVFELSLDSSRSKLRLPWNFKSYKNNEYLEGASEELEKMAKDLEHELSLDFYSAFKVLVNVKEQLQNEAKEIVYNRIRKSGDKYLRNGQKYTGQMPTEDEA